MDGAERDEFHRSALALLTALDTNCFETRPDAQGLLHDGTYHAHKGRGVEAYFICGDCFFLEAMLALEGKAPDSWGTGGTWRTLKDKGWMTKDGERMTMAGGRLK